MHRLVTSKEIKIRTFIVKFEGYNTRNGVFRNKKKTKRKKVSITESLTKIRMKVIKRAREKFEFHSVWTYGGKVIYKDVNDSKIKTYYDQIKL